MTGCRYCGQGRKPVCEPCRQMQEADEQREADHRAQAYKCEYCGRWVHARDEHARDCPRHPDGPRAPAQAVLGGESA